MNVASLARRLDKLTGDSAEKYQQAWIRFCLEHRLPHMSTGGATCYEDLLHQIRDTEHEHCQP